MSGLMPTTREQQRELGSSEIRKMLSDYIRRRVPEPDVDDVVQTVLVEALASDTVPSDKTELRKWLTGVARHKIADLHRKGARERPAEIPDIETAPPPVEEHELVRWAEEQAKQGGKEGDATLRWMAREGEGDKLEHIAAEEKLPAATVRQRVSRMRRFMRERWMAEIAAAALVVGLLVFVVYRFVLRPKPEDIAKEVPTVEPPPKNAPPVAPSPLERAAELRKTAFSACERGDDKGCEEKLDEAKRLDPAGEANPDVKRWRDALRSKQAPQPQDSSAPPVPSDVKGDGFGNGNGEPTPTPTPQRTGTPFSAPPKPPGPTSTSFQKAAPKSVGKPSFDKKSGSSFELGTEPNPGPSKGVKQ